MKAQEKKPGVQLKLNNGQERVNRNFNKENQRHDSNKNKIWLMVENVEGRENPDKLNQQSKHKTKHELHRKLARN